MLDKVLLAMSVVVLIHCHSHLKFVHLKQMHAGLQLHVVVIADLSLLVVVALVLAIAVLAHLVIAIATLVHLDPQFIGPGNHRVLIVRHLRLLRRLAAVIRVPELMETMIFSFAWQIPSAP